MLSGMLVPQDVHDLGGQTLGRIHDTTFLEESEVFDDEITNHLLSYLLHLAEEVELLAHIAQLCKGRVAQVPVEDGVDGVGYELGLEGYDVVHDYIIAEFCAGQSTHSRWDWSSHQAWASR